MKYRYELHFYSNMGELYDIKSKWHKSLEYCKNNCNRTLESKSLKEELFNNEVCNCYIQAIIVCDKFEYNDFTRYEIIEYIDCKDIEEGCLTILNRK